jgi:hypothetical protein
MKHPKEEPPKTPPVAVEKKKREASEPWAFSLAPKRWLDKNVKGTTRYNTKIEVMTETGSEARLQARE